MTRHATDLIPKVRLWWLTMRAMTRTRKVAIAVLGGLVLIVVLWSKPAVAVIALVGGSVISAVIVAAPAEVRQLREAAKQGDAESQWKLGEMYDNGEGGLPTDVFEAARWYRASAEQGNADAQMSLGTMYATGEGVEKDATEVVRWYRLAADQSHANAQCQLGHIYMAGIGVPKDDAEAMRWYRLAAEQGHADAQMNLGIMYTIDQDYVAAYAWLNLAAVELLEAAEQRDELAELMTFEQIRQAQRIKPTSSSGQALSDDEAKWLQTLAEHGDAVGQWRLGMMYTKGEGGLPKDAVEAARWYRAAAEQGNVHAQTLLGSAYGAGEGVEQVLNPK